jgi:hypothetical protein
MMASPYDGLTQDEWYEKTLELIDEHPLDPMEIVEICLDAWESIFESFLGTQGFKIGTHIFPKPQILGFFLHELIPLELKARYPDEWRGEECKTDKDLVYIPDINYSIEIKTSSSAGQIYGNRSFGQISKAKKEKKEKSGYYIAINFNKVIPGKDLPSLRLLRLGWLDNEDWIPQKSPSGQQARLPPEVNAGKLIQYYPEEE